MVEMTWQTESRSAGFCMTPSYFQIWQRKPKSGLKTPTEKQCLRKNLNEGGDGECRISLGRVQKRDPVEQMAGRLGFRENTSFSEPFLLFELLLL